MTTICGHERDVLIWALRHAEATGDHHVSGDPMPYAIACGEVLDPAKLAEMLAARGRELGFARPDEQDTPPDNQISIGIHGGMIWFGIGNDRRKPFFMPKAALSFTMPQARALLLQWLQLPDGAREEAERVLRGNHDGFDEFSDPISAQETCA